MRSFRRPVPSGQTLVETALVLPLFLTVVLGVIVLGIGLFYQQQITNAAREAARYAAVHSATSDCPTSSRRSVNNGMVPVDAVLTGSCFGGLPTGSALTSWPNMQGHGRQRAGFGFSESQLHFSACWAGYTDVLLEAAGQPAWDAPPFRDDGDDVDTALDENRWDACTIGGRDPASEAGLLSCPPPVTTTTDDTASNLAVSSGSTANQVTVYACYRWQPPLAGFLLIPETITLRATVSESLQHQR
jgi:hypothetical protein